MRNRLTGPLTPRETDVLQLMSVGIISHTQIGDVLCITPGTVRCHKRAIYSKLGVRSKKEILTLFTALRSLIDVFRAVTHTTHYAIRDT